MKSTKPVDAQPTETNVSATETHVNLLETILECGAVEKDVCRPNESKRKV